ncbi:predicted protein [Naegleria gruberi]|uniref:ubiquitinyl hydrolase 1 n=1 Tax=Naegleria gruberi TaxID=5762 RepID=D2VHT1_NAEGR|nr:uncharacterized protein NAEGRDRAFT_68435 [Naegleria gruberi]EFC43728.1 predicted protein [Naegleria gruberi]|eukprot:XP_002676472.1 predicted protein [Naegleria gruberi strain NEG-M]
MIKQRSSITSDFSNADDDEQSNVVASSVDKLIDPQHYLSSSSSTVQSHRTNGISSYGTTTNNDSVGGASYEFKSSSPLNIVEEPNHGKDDHHDESISERHDESKEEFNLPLHKPLMNQYGLGSSCCVSTTYLLQSIAPRSSCKTELIHEKQKRQLCAKHSINNLLQQKLETNEFDKVADCIFNTERELYYGSFDSSSSRLSRWFKKKSMSNYHKKKILLLGSFGNYSYEVVESILTQKQMKLHNLKPSELNENNLSNDLWNLKDPKMVGLLFNQQYYVQVGGGGCLPFFASKRQVERRPASGHWWAVGKIILNEERELWFNHDSKLKEPYEIETIENVYKYVYSLCKDNQDILVWKVEG